MVNSIYEKLPNCKRREKKSLSAQGGQFVVLGDIQLRKGQSEVLKIHLLYLFLRRIKELHLNLRSMQSVRFCHFLWICLLWHELNLAFSVCKEPPIWWYSMVPNSIITMITWPITCFWQGTWWNLAVRLFPPEATKQQKYHLLLTLLQLHRYFSLIVVLKSWAYSSIILCSCSLFQRAADQPRIHRF